jgi:hypothetical protein
LANQPPFLRHMFTQVDGYTPMFLSSVSAVPDHHHR